MQHLYDHAPYACRVNTRGLPVSDYLCALPAEYSTFTEVEAHARGAEDDLDAGHCAIESRAYWTR